MGTNAARVQIREQTFVRAERGQALVEAAITLLLLFVFIFAIFEAGRLVQVQQALTDAAREGARYAVVPLTRTDTLAPDGDVVNVVKAYLIAASLHDPDGAAATSCGTRLCIATPDRAYPCRSGSATPTQCTRVTVTYLYPVMTLSMFGNLNMTLTGQSMMRNETSP